MTVNRVVIVGGGVGAAAVAEQLRAEGFDGQIVQVSDEKTLPYDRPPLSKAYLAGEAGLADILLHPEDWYVTNKVELKLGSGAKSIDVASREVVLADGERVGFDCLLIANGSRARLFPGLPAEIASIVHYVRTTQDAENIRSLAAAGKRAVMIGGGVIGVETAATLRLLGCEVTVLEMAPRIMARFFPAELSAKIAELHARRGVKILTGISIAAIRAANNGAEVCLADGTTIPADLLVIGIGVVPNAELGSEAGLKTECGGIAVDGYGQTSAPGIYAIGDVAAFPLPDGTVTRWENWTHARNQGAVAVKHMLGKETAPYADTPWIWSDQYDFNIQVTGSPEAEQVVFREDVAARRITAFHLTNGKVVGATTINDSRNKASVRKLIERGAIVPADKLADVSVDLKKLVAAL